MRDAGSLIAKLRRVWIDARLRRITNVSVAVAIIISMLAADAGWSQAARTIRIIVTLAPGGAVDFLARVLAEQVGRQQAITTVVENRPGAGTVIGTEAVSRAVPDGSTVMLTDSSFVVSPHLRKVTYDPLNAFEPICDLASVPTLIAVNSESPYRTLAELLDAARAKPGELTLATPGPATVFHIGFEKLKRAANVDMTYIPYTGGGPVLNALLGGHVTSILNSYSTSSAQLKAGKLRALATATLTRIEPLPDVPTVAEFGYQNTEVDFWIGLFAPAKTPKQTVSQLAAWFIAALQVPEVKAKLEDQGLYPVVKCGVDFDALIRKQYEQYGQVIRETNIKVE